MSIQLEFPQFKLEGETVNDALINARNRTIAWSACVKANYLNADEAECLKKLSDYGDTRSRVAAVLKNPELYAEKMMSLISNNSAPDDIVHFTLVCIIDTLVMPGSDFSKTLLALSHEDSKLPYEPLKELLGSKNATSRLCATYILTLLLTDDAAVKDGKNQLLKPLFKLISDELLKSKATDLNFAGVQLMKELLQIKQYRDYYWTQQHEDFPPLLQILVERRGELQMKYYTTLAVWLITFNKQAVIDINEQYPNIIETLYGISKDAVKEKIVRLAIDSLLNLLNISDSKLKEQVVKHYLLAGGLDITKQLLERKWADEELKDDLNVMLETLNEAVTTLTTFDEYLNELTTKTFVWSPLHKSEEFWYENIDRFKANGWKLLKEMLALLKEETDDEKRLYQNQAVICHDVNQMIQQAPETVRAVEKNGGKTTIMNLMNSASSNVKYEALRTTQQLVAMSL